MRKQWDNRGPMSRLPDDAAYWQALTDRLVKDAGSRLSAYRGVGMPWWHALARFATPLAVGAAAAVTAAWLWLPEAGNRPPRSLAPETLYAFPANEPLVALFVTSTTAPTMATLIATPTGGRAP